MQLMPKNNMRNHFKMQGDNLMEIIFQDKFTYHQVKHLWSLPYKST